MASEEPVTRKLGVKLLERHRDGVELAAHGGVVRPVHALDEVYLARVEQQRGVVGFGGHFEHAHFVSFIGGVALLVLGAQGGFCREVSPVFLIKCRAGQEQRFSQSVSAADEASAAFDHLAQPCEHQAAAVGRDVGKGAFAEYHLGLEQAHAREVEQGALFGGKKLHARARDAFKAEMGDCLLCRDGASGYAREESQIRSHGFAVEPLVRLHEECAPAP